MSENSGSDNPFAALISEKNSSSENDIVIDDVNDSDGKSVIKEVSKEKRIGKEWSAREIEINRNMEYVFRLVLKKNGSKSHGGIDAESKRVSIKCTLMDDESHSLITIDNVDQILCDRLMMDNVMNKQMDVQVNVESDSLVDVNEECEHRILHYLYQCFARIEIDVNVKLPSTHKAQLKSKIKSQAAMFLCHPDLYPNQDKSYKACILKLLEDYYDYPEHHYSLKAFIESITEEVVRKHACGEEDVPLVRVIKPSYEALCEKFVNVSIVDPSLSRYFKLLQHFVSTVNLSKAFIDLNFPKETTIGMINFRQTCLGLLLSISCLPRPTMNQLEFFLNPSQYDSTEHTLTEKNIWMQLNKLNSDVVALIKKLLKQPETKNSTLKWIEICLHSCRDRAKMWTNEVLMMTNNFTDPTDGFILNLSYVLLQLSMPFCASNISSVASPKLLKVDARFCQLGSQASKFAPHSSNAYFEALKEEATLIANDNLNDEVNLEKFEWNFMTECFIATHRSLQLGFRSVNERFLKLAQELQKIQRIYEESSQSGNSDAATMLRERMDKYMTQYLSIRTALNETFYTDSLMQFYIASAIWLNNLAINENEIKASSQFTEIKLPLPTEFSSKCLMNVPEFVVENITEYFVYLHRFNEKTLLSPQFNLEPLITMILIFMGSPVRMKNPHLRANLAEMLEALVPRKNHNQSFGINFSNLDKLFTSHPFCHEFVPTIIHVFVSIELSDAAGNANETVAFEQKFQYRRPIYSVLGHLWTIESHRLKMKELADHAEANIDAISAPLFVKFVNFLINDATFLLDEALTFMTQLKELQKQKESGAWKTLPLQQRQQNEANMHHIGRLARFHNIIGRDTIHTLSWVTDHIKTFFCAKSFVNRMAEMLNYLLLKLVGPQSKSLRSKNMNDYDFKPTELVHDICRIYINLASQENKRFKTFCLAVGKDDRSYSPELFANAEQVLIKTGNAGLAVETTSVANMIEQLRQCQLRREVSLDDVPEEYLDPIMNSLMSDPVTLPNSGVKVDRSTIARHLLSDPTDPFTRSPLTMEMVIPDDELKQKIRHFIDVKVKSKKQEEASQKEESIK